MLKIEIKWNELTESYTCKIAGFGDIRFQGKDGDDLALNVGHYIKRWEKHEREKNHALHP